VATDYLLGILGEATMRGDLLTVSLCSLAAGVAAGQPAARQRHGHGATCPGR
jgi:hypothetical protein